MVNRMHLAERFGRDSRVLAAFDKWKAEPVTNFMSALGRVEVTIKRADGSTEVIKPFTLKEWETNVHTVEDVIALKKKLEEKA